MSTGGAESLSGIHGGTPPLTGPSAVEVMSSVRRGSWPPYGQTGASIRSDGCCEFIKLCLMPSSSSTPSFIKVFVFVYIFTHTHTHTHTRQTSLLMVECHLQAFNGSMRMLFPSTCQMISLRSWWETISLPQRNLDYYSSSFYMLQIREPAFMEFWSAFPLPAAFHSNMFKVLSLLHCVLQPGFCSERVRPSPLPDCSTAWVLL